ncbi:MAG: alanine--tRNA ligase [Mucinivorans sp.]
MNSSQIRQKFFDFFASKDHKIVPSAPMVIKNDPTLMFTNAGMNQFKDIFLGNEKRFTPRAADSQKCLRVSGKHNDLAEVGHDTYHHTMFEMLGNWSFADYFKTEAIGWAWELLTEVYGLDPKRMYATVFEGSTDDNVPFDTEAYQTWKKFLPEDHILRGNKKDNFWEMGATGPCGPCSELHYDVREDTTTPGAELVNQDNPEVIEIWNLVFMQFNRMADGHLVQLPACHVDTGMGFERLCMVVQGKRSNYDTDVFEPLLTKIAELAQGTAGSTPREIQIAQRVIADHLRAIAFSIADGQLPSNVKAGYVIRRILRRAVRYGYTYLGVREPFLTLLVPTLVDQMGDQFPELRASISLIESVIREEESSFLRTLATGIAKIENGDLRIENGVLNGADAFELYDTYGFPIDLTELIMEEKGVKVDLVDFDKYLGEQKARSRSAAAVSADDWVELLPIEHSEFVGYDTAECSTNIARYRRVSSKGRTYYQIVLDTTPFYAASGGQTGDSGVLRTTNYELKITDTIKENNLTIHLADSIPGDEIIGDTFTASVATSLRDASAANHTATHLLHNALRKVLGAHVEQKGSLVTPDYLRFDFSHFAKVSPEDLRTIEKMVNEKIRADIHRDERRGQTMEAAKAMGAMALFGEKYGDSVRVIRYGDSVELCGGMHATSTGRLGLFHIISEGSSSAGIRRIEAITGLRAEEHLYHQQDILSELSQALGTNQFTAAIAKISSESAATAHQLDEIRASRDKYLIAEFGEQADDLGDYLLVNKTLNVVPESIKNIALELTKNERMIVVLGSGYGDKPAITVALGAIAQAAGLKAGDIVRAAAKAIQGGGGGGAAMATAGGKNRAGLDEGVKIAVETIKQIIG